VSRLLVRFAKRKTPWEECDPEQIRESEFKDRNGEGYDLRPSVYDIAPSEVVRTFAEHAAAATGHVLLASAAVIRRARITESSSLSVTVVLMSWLMVGGGEVAKVVTYFVTTRAARPR